MAETLALARPAETFGIAGAEDARLPDPRLDEAPSIAAQEDVTTSLAAPMSIPPGRRGWAGATCAIQTCSTSAPSATCSGIAGGTG